MKLKDIVERLANLVEVEIIIDDYGTVGEVYNGLDTIDTGYLNSEVETIDTSEDGILILVVDGNTGTEEE